MSVQNAGGIGDGFVAMVVGKAVVPADLGQHRREGHPRQIGNVDTQQKLLHGGIAHGADGVNIRSADPGVPALRSAVRRVSLSVASIC